MARFETQLQLLVTLAPDGGLAVEVRHAPPSPERARILWQELADYAQRRALFEQGRLPADLDNAPPTGPLPVVLPPELLAAS
ncbi:MAG: hypothetical protein ACOVNL_13710 [Prochlorococcaceae cyanobacterium]|jgi:hypothetical protein